MSWTQERITSALSQLDAPTGDAAFWERVHTDLLGCEPELEQTTDLVSFIDLPMTEVQKLLRYPRRTRWYVAAGAAAAVLIAGLYVVGHASNETPQGNASSTHIVLTDPLSLTLDDQPRTTAPAVSHSEYVLPDVTKLPPGWTATEQSAFSFIWQPNDGYRAVYSLVTPTAATYRVDVTAGLDPQPDNGTRIDINGHDALQNANSVWWRQEPGVGVTVTTTSESAAVDLTNAARGLVFATVNELPLVAIDTEAQPHESEADFAGTLNGVHYAVSTNSGPLRGIRVSIADQGESAGVYDDRLSQPTDEPQAAGTVNIDGVAGYGVIVFGYTEPATAALRANLANGSTIQVPVLRNPGETYFVLPVPLGVEVTTLDFLEAAGTTLRTATMPTLSPSFGSCCANAPWTTDVQPGSDAAPPPT